MKRASGLALFVTTLCACSVGADASAPFESGDGGLAETQGEGGEEEEGEGDDGEENDEEAPLFDVPNGGDDEGADSQCDAPLLGCDDPQNPAGAMGLCPDQIHATVTGPQPGNYGVRSGFGNTEAFAATDGLHFAVLGTGFVADLGEPAGPNVCNDATQPQYNGGQTLPPPIVPTDAGPTTCDVDPDLVGGGDCSNTIQQQYEQGVAPYDYTEIRFTATVPDTASSFSFDFAFFSVEYPVFYGKQFNDMFVGWLESEAWTGNVSFDDAGNPISLNASFLDHRDVPDGTENDPECQDGCVAEALHDTCMEGHAGTKWLTTTASVSPGEEITMVFAIFDLSDPNLDSYVFIDGFRWGCDDNPPITEPAG